MNKTQPIVITIIMIEILIFWSTENAIIHVISGTSCAIGLSLILKLPPFKKMNPSD